MPKTLDEFRDQLTAHGARHINRTTDACDWFVGDRQVFHERSYWPWNPFDEASVQYWSETVYTNSDMAKRDAERFGARVAECPYCSEDQPLWFLIFDDIEKASAHAFEHYAEFQPSIPEPNHEFRAKPLRFQSL